MCSATATADVAQILPGHYRLNAAGCSPPHATSASTGTAVGRTGSEVGQSRRGRLAHAGLEVISFDFCPSRFVSVFFPGAIAIEGAGEAIEDASARSV